METVTPLTTLRENFAKAEKRFNRAKDHLRDALLAGHNVPVTARDTVAVNVPARGRWSLVYTLNGEQVKFAIPKDQAEELIKAGVPVAG